VANSESDLLLYELDWNILNMKCNAGIKFLSFGIKKESKFKVEIECHTDQKEGSKNYSHLFRSMILA
jgi:hypothetical protein